MFDGASLAGWKLARFGGEGDVSVEAGRMILGTGEMLTGLTVQDGASLPRTDYEVEVEAARIEGSDFFCGLTFPVADSHCSLIVGGWGGSLVGLSSLDGLDASDNETGTTFPFEDDRVYRIRLRVTKQRIRAWIEDELVIDADIRGRKVSIRQDIAESLPFGIASFMTTAAISSIRLRRLEKVPE